MIVFLIALQLFRCFVVQFSGTTLVTAIVVAFFLRGDEECAGGLGA